MIETELKYQLTETQFQHLLHAFDLASQTPITQINTYYDTLTQSLKELHAALRLRRFNTYSEWTIKQKQDAYRSLELTQICDAVVEASAQLTSNTITQPDLIQFLAEHHIKIEKLHIIAEFTTKRWLYQTEYGEYAFDMTLYGDQCDYEVELETQDFSKAQAEIQTLFAQHAIPLHPASKKIARVLQYFQSIND